MVNKKREESPDSSSSSDISNPVGPIGGDQLWLNNALRGGQKYRNKYNKCKILKNRPTENSQIDHFFGIGDVTKIILEYKCLRDIRASEIKKVSDYLNDKNNCFEIVANLNARKAKVNLKLYYLDSVVTNYLNEETSNGKKVKYYITKNVIRMTNDESPDNDLIKYIGNYLHKHVINKINDF
jgi:uncharacterized protein YejL (UPF0352 family)